MKKLALNFVIAFSLVSSPNSFADQSGRLKVEVLDGSSYLESLKSASVIDKSKTNISPASEWEKAIAETALKYGTQAGAYWESKNLIAYLTVKQKFLDSAFPFAPLLIKYPKYLVAPAVISEDNGRMRVTDSGQTLRILGKTFVINVKPRFVFTSLGWRNYLYLSSAKPVEPFAEMRPKNDKEKKIWDDNIEKGWDVGVKSVDYTIKIRFARMVRDYAGMTRYHVLRSKNMVTEPIISEAYKPVSGGGRVLNIEDSVISINKTPEMNMDRMSWAAMPQLPDASYLFPNGIYDNTPSLFDSIGYAGHQLDKYSKSELNDVSGDEVGK